jgi:hypothetical protein
MAKAVGYYLWPPVWIDRNFSNPHITSADRQMLRQTIEFDLPSGLKALVMRDGYISFDFTNANLYVSASSSPADDFDQAAERLYQSVSVLNAHLACLYMALSERQHFALHKMVLTPREVITSQTGAGDWAVIDMRLSECLLFSFEYVKKSYHEIVMDWRFSSRVFTVSLETLEYSFELLNQILAHPDGRLLQLVELYLRSLNAYEDHNFHSCLITAWAIIEVLIQEQWNTYLGSNREKIIDGNKQTFINKKRMDILESKDYTASIIIETLSLLNEIPFDLYQQLTIIRKARNDWIHSLKAVSRGQAETSLLSVEKLFFSMKSLKLHAIGGLQLLL